MTNHTGPVKGLDFNPIKNNILASGATKGEVGHILFPLSVPLILVDGLHHL